MTSLSILKDWKREIYNLIPVIIKKLTNITHYKPVKTNINITKNYQDDQWYYD